MRSSKGVRLLCAVFAALVPSSVEGLNKEDIEAICHGSSDLWPGGGPPNSTIRVGVITKGNEAKAMKEWPPTFEIYLSAQLAKYGCRSQVVPLDFDEYNDYVREKRIDFLFPNPTCFQEMKEQYGVHEFISVKRNWGVDDELDRFGGTIARRADRHTDILTLADIKSKCVGCKVCLVNPAAFGGWHIQKYALLKDGIDTDKDVKMDVLGKHEISMMGLFHNGITKKDGTKLDGLCDISVSRTGILESLIAASTWEGLPTFNASDVYTIKRKGRSAQEIRDEEGFPQRLSTVLYPEWPLASLSHVPRDFESVVAIPLLSMSKESHAAKEGKHAGFAFPYSYEPVRKLFIAIDHYGNGKCDPGNEREIHFPRQCKPCPRGTATSTGLDRKCPSCEVGKFASTTGMAECKPCKPSFTTKEVGASTEAACVPSGVDIVLIVVVGSILGCGLLTFMCYEVFKRWLRYRKLRRLHEARMEHTIEDAVKSLETLQYPVNLVSATDFLSAGKLVMHEVLRNQGKIEVLDSLEEVTETQEERPILFFSHQWTGFTEPDPSGIQYRTMTNALTEVAKVRGWDLNSLRVWVDYSSIPQKHSGIQSLAIRSLASYASTARAFVIVAPDCPHADLKGAICNVASYQRRMWCRAEQICYSLRNGISDMFIATDGGISPIDDSWFAEALRVFDGDLTCCRLKHRGMQACDRQSLVVPILGLYGELYAAAMHSSSGGGGGGTDVRGPSNVKDFLNEIEENKDRIFPRQFTFVQGRSKGKGDIGMTTTLFGDLVERMQKHVKAQPSRVIKACHERPSFTQPSTIQYGAVGRRKKAKRAVVPIVVGSDEKPEHDKLIL